MNGELGRGRRMPPTTVRQAASQAIANHALTHGGSSTGRTAASAWSATTQASAMIWRTTVGLRPPEGGSGSTSGA